MKPISRNNIIITRALYPSRSSRCFLINEILKNFMKEFRLKISILSLLCGCIISSCSSEKEIDENIYFQDLIGTWKDNDTYFETSLLYFRSDGKGQYEFGNNLPTGNGKHNFTWDYSDYSSEFVKIDFESSSFITSDEGGRLFRGWPDTSCLILDFMGSRWTKISSEDPYFSGGENFGGGNHGNGGNGTIDIDFLCKNKGVWRYENSYSNIISGNIQYYKSIDEFNFAKGGTILGYFYWEGSGKSGYPLTYQTRKSEVLAIGSYQIQGNTLKCIFSNVSCSGSSDIETKHWKPGVTNYKNYAMEYEEDGTLVLSFGEEIYRVKNGSQSSNPGGGDSSYEIPDVTYYDAVPGKTNIKVTYKIWNKNKCGSLSNAKIYYGTSSANKSVSASISGDYISANISGLSKGSKYKVKCSVSGSAGNITTEETTLSTLY